MANIKLDINESEIEVLTALLEWAVKNGKDQNKVKTAQNIKDRIRILSERESLDNYLYLTGLDEESLDYFFRMKKLCDLNIYISFSAVINGHPQNTLEQCFDYYYIKNLEKRPQLFENIEMTKKIFSFVYKRMKAKGYKI